MFDVFYLGTKPGLFVHEKPVQTLEQAQRQSQTRYCWVVTYLADYSDWDWLWEPPPWQSQYTHVWPSQHHEFSGTYLVPKTGAIEYHFNSKVIPNRHWPSRFVTHGHNVDFDYTWAPHPCDPAYIYVFGNQWWPAEKMSTVEYHVPGATERKYMHQPRATLLPRHSNHWYTVIDCEWDYSWCPDPGDPAYIYVFGNQWWSAEKMPTVEYHVPGAKERKYMTWPRARLLPDLTHWSVPNNIDTAALDFTWRPDPGEPPYIYQFATQHQKTGGPRYTVPGATDVKYMAELKVRTVGQATAVIEINHLDGNVGKIDNVSKTVRYFDNYRDTLIRIANGLDCEWVWICSSICDYSNFDFTWHPNQWQSTMLHVFASNEQKFGDTFFMHVPTFQSNAKSKQLLEWYDLNFVSQSVPRWPMQQVIHAQDTHVDQVKNQETVAPLVLYSNRTVSDHDIPTVSLWRQETKTVVPLDTAAGAVVVPHVAKPYIKTQLYDYPYIDKTYKNTLSITPQDIVFISYDEPEADRNWQILHDKFPKSKRVHGIAGMENALEAAANVSDTPWYWAVFAKTELAPDFDFSYMPDYLQQPKHYIFNCFNVVNGLEYGHMGVVLYNCQGIQLLNQSGHFGLDYTLSFAHESVPILSCIGRFNTTPYHTWRTAFRETAKLAFFESQQNTVEGQYRLRAWLEKAQGHNAAWCLKGARDGVDFFDSTNGDLEKLKQSFRWEWLRSYFNHRYGDLE